MSDPSAETLVRDANRVREFLADDAISASLGRMERRYYEEFVGATSSEERIRAQAKAVVLRDFLSEMAVTLDRGEVAVLAAAKKHTKE
jgi:hypothetical protein